MQDYSSVRTLARAAHPAVAGSSQEVDAEAVLSDWDAINSDFGLEGTSGAAFRAYAKGVKDERERRRKADEAAKVLPEEGWRIRTSGYAYDSDGRLRRERVLERWESRVVGPFWHRRLEFGWHQVARELYQINDVDRVDTLLIQTAWLEEKTNPLELLWTFRGRKQKAAPTPASQVD